MDKNQLFKQYESEPNPEHWLGFPELMWDLGFEMDCLPSVRSSFHEVVCLCASCGVLSLAFSINQFLLKHWIGC